MDQQNRSPRGFTAMKTVVTALLAASIVVAAYASAQNRPVRNGFAGTYILERRQNQPLPHALPFSRGGHACKSVLYRDVLILHPDSTWDETLAYAHGCDPDPLPDPQENRGAGRIRWRDVRGDTIELIDTLETLNFTMVGTFGPGTLRIVTDGPSIPQPILYDYRRAP